MSRWKSSGLFPQCDLGNTMWQRGKKEDVRKNKARSGIKRARRLSTLDFIFYTGGERKNVKEGRKKRREKCAIESKKATRRDGRGRLYGPMGDARKTRWERRAPVFRGGWKNICIHPRPFLSLSPLSAARFFDIGSGVSIFQSFASRSDFRTEPLLFPPCIQSPIPFPLLPLPPLLSLLVRQFSYPPLPASLCLSSLSSSHEGDSHPLFSSRRRNVHQKIWILRRIVYDSVSRTFCHCARMTRGQREKLRAVLNECEKKRRDGDGDGRNLHWCNETAFARI